MQSFLLRIYDFLREHKRLTLLSFLAVTSVFFLLVLKLDYKEDISDFLPLDDRHQEALSVYQDVSGANKILAIFKSKDPDNVEPDVIGEAIYSFEEFLEEIDTAALVRNLVTEFDLEKMSEISDFAYHNIPYFLTREDYARMDSLLSIPDYVGNRIDEDKQMLMFPTSGLLSANMQKDPLNLFSPVVAKLSRDGGANIELYDGHIFTKDMTIAIAMMESPYGNSETQRNAVLMEMLDHVAGCVEADNPDVSLHYIGGPAIAVGNASQIKKDSILSIAIAAILIIALLIIAFRRPWNILMIAVSVAWGWLFAMAMLSLIHDSVSLIVIGISSIILGIAVNYPLHLIAHTAHAMSMRQALREIVAPLFIGNVTTVGAFMALVPLQATALRDLGIFAALILIGTIIFVVIYLPHSVNERNAESHHSVKFLDWLSNISLENNKWVIVTVIALTGVFAFFSFHTKFDANMSHINYMTDQQHADMEYFKQFTSGETDSVMCLYVVTCGSSLDDALDASISLQDSISSIATRHASSKVASCLRFLPSQREQVLRLEMWNDFIARHHELFANELPAQAHKYGFRSDAFEDFTQIINGEYAQQSLDYFDPLHEVYAQSTSIDSIQRKYRVITSIFAAANELESIKDELHAIPGTHFCFDVPSMNSAMANSLSDNFNYIGWACAFIVFFFLWFSFASIELAALSFLPMAVSWIWILGIMGMTGIQFNIVNIILATFIFGQGDDYTIFMTEGCCYEYAYRKKMLASYKRSIIISALIMFIGIGTLIFAKHPALHSLAEVTIVGMLSVVLMAYLLPPLVFNWLTKQKGEYRKRPLTFPALLRTWFCGAWWLTQLLCGYVCGIILFCLLGHGQKANRILHRIVTWSHRLDCKIMPGVKVTFSNPHDENLDKPCIIVCNHQSMLDPMFLMAWSSKVLIVANERSSLNPIVRTMFKWLGFYTIRQDNSTIWKDTSLDRDMEKLRAYIEQGYSIAFFPEGVRNTKSTVLRYHRGAFYLAQQLGVDVLPVYLHGVNNVMPKGSFACYKGSVHIIIGERIARDNSLWSDDHSVMAKQVHAMMSQTYAAICHRLEDSSYFAPLVIDRYRYKGTEVMHDVKANLKRTNNYSEIANADLPSAICILNSGYGELPLLVALVHRDAKIIAYEADDEKRLLAKYAAQGLTINIDYRSLKDYEPDNEIYTYDMAKM